MSYLTHHPIRKLSKAGEADTGDLHSAYKQSADKVKKSGLEDIFPDYPGYPPDEDIYSNYTKEAEIDPEQTSRLKETKILSELIDQLDFNKELPTDDLDVPGAELDDQQEIIGSEDEENNYYSLGGDNHDDLDETNNERI